MQVYCGELRADCSGDGTIGDTFYARRTDQKMYAITVLRIRGNGEIPKKGGMYGEFGDAHFAISELLFPSLGDFLCFIFSSELFDRAHNFAGKRIGRRIFVPLLTIGQKAHAHYREACDGAETRWRSYELHRYLSNSIPFDSIL